MLADATKSSMKLRKPVYTKGQFRVAVSVSFLSRYIWNTRPKTTQKILIRQGRKLKECEKSSQEKSLLLLKCFGFSH